MKFFGKFAKIIWKIDGTFLRVFPSNSEFQLFKELLYRFATRSFDKKWLDWKCWAYRIYRFWRFFFRKKWHFLENSHKLLGKSMAIFWEFSPLIQNLSFSKSSYIGLLLDHFTNSDSTENVELIGYIDFGDFFSTKITFFGKFAKIIWKIGEPFRLTFWCWELVPPPKMSILGHFLKHFQKF